MMDTYDGTLLTDLYQLTMLQAYHERGMDETAVFEFFVRDLPPGRGFLIAAGLEQLLLYLENLRFRTDDLEWLSQCGYFTPSFVDTLAALRFTGDVHAMKEGTVFFPDEPIVRVAAPLSQAQLVETRLINLLHFQSLIASKAARAVLAAPGKLLVDFGLRRAHGAEAGLLAARASYLAGFSGTATVLAARLFGIPMYGTMAHSFVQAHDDEASAFEHFARAQPDNVVLLLDTYDTETAAHKTLELARRLAPAGIRIKAVRLDSGDLADHARKVRAIFDQGGQTGIRIFCSGNLDEHALRELLSSGAPIDGFGVGTRMDTSADAPYLDCAYKLQEYAGRPRRKRSEGKATWPGRKQVYRHYDAGGCMHHDVLALEDERHEGEPLLQPVMRNGRRLAAPEPLSALRGHAARELERLPEHLKQLTPIAARYPVEITTALRELAAAVDQAATHRQQISAKGKP